MKSKIKMLVLILSAPVIVAGLFLLRRPFHWDDTDSAFLVAMTFINTGCQLAINRYLE